MARRASAGDGLRSSGASDRGRKSPAGVSDKGGGGEGCGRTGDTGEAREEGGARPEEWEALRDKAEGMRKEILEQERLLQAYQKENEKLLEKAKEVGSRGLSTVTSIFGV